MLVSEGASLHARSTQTPADRRVDALSTVSKERDAVDALIDEGHVPAWMSWWSLAAISNGIESAEATVRTEGRAPVRRRGQEKKEEEEEEEDARRSEAGPA